jgi:proline dehydrogenase
MQFISACMAHAIAWLPRPLVRKISRRYIAGNRLEDAIVRIRALNALGFRVTVDVLGETITNAAQAAHTAREYVEVLEAIHAHGLDAGISVKPTALGLLIDAAQCENMFTQLVEVAKKHQLPVCMDMEDARCTPLEIALFSRLRQRGGELSLALQAYLLRSYSDIEKLLLEKSDLRICKGIYVEDRAHLVADAWHDRRAINSHFLHHVERCFDEDVFVAIATHDEVLVAQVIALVQRRGVDPAQFEFQMLLGVCEPLRDRLLASGFLVRIYVPYGSDWYGYSVRRLKENPRIAGYVVKALLGF